MDFCRADVAAFLSRGIISIFCEETVSGRRTFVFCQIFRDWQTTGRHWEDDDDYSNSDDKCVKRKTFNKSHG